MLSSMSRRPAFVGVGLLLAFLIAMLMATGVGLASSVSSPTDEGTPSGDSLSMVGGCGLLTFGVVAVGLALRALLATSAALPRRYELVAAWALAGAFLVITALVALLHFVPLNDYVKPIMSLVLAIVGMAAALGSGYCFKTAYLRVDDVDLQPSD
jgi:uncharacterized membrane protein YhhN